VPNIDGARQELLLAAGLLELGRAELGVVRLGVQRMGRQVAERFAHAVHGELILHRFERCGAPEEGQELLAAPLPDDLADALVDDQVPGDRRHEEKNDQQHPCDDVGLLKEMAKAQG
jgi:hypothetical protein